jgi:hypothetical protein
MTNKQIENLLFDARTDTYLYGRNASGMITDLANALEQEHMKVIALECPCEFCNSEEPRTKEHCPKMYPWRSMAK